MVIRKKSDLMSFVYKFIIPTVAGNSQCCGSKKVAKKVRAKTSGRLSDLP